MTSPPSRLRDALRRPHAGLLLPLLLAACTPAGNPTAAPPVATYAAVARGRVDVEGGLLALSMPREGALAEVDVHEGDRVRRGQQLAALDSEPAKLAVATAQAEFDQAQAQLTLLGRKLAAAQVRAQRLQAAATAGAGDGQSADDARDVASQLMAEQAAARAATRIAAGKLAQARYELGQRSLRAPLDADVVRAVAQPGASVSPQSGSLFTLLPLAPRIVRAELSEAYIDAVRVGMHAEVSPDDAGATHWSAHVLRVGRVIGPSQLEDDPQLRANTRTVECVLGFDQPQDLRIGQRVLLRFGAATAAPKGPAKD